MLSSALLLYQFRTFERQMGTSKFSAFVIFVCLIASTVQLGFIVSLPPLQRVAAGPYALIFALFVLFYGAHALHAECVDDCRRRAVAVSHTLTHTRISPSSRARSSMSHRVVP
jgi:hypothetical protein